MTTSTTCSNITLKSLLYKPLPMTSIPALLDTLYLFTFKPIYLVFDQFEEIFTLGTHCRTGGVFPRTLRMLQRADAHKVKIVLVMREEYFASLDGLRTPAARPGPEPPPGGAHVQPQPPNR